MLVYVHLTRQNLPTTYVQGAAAKRIKTTGSSGKRDPKKRDRTERKREKKPQGSSSTIKVAFPSSFSDRSRPDKKKPQVEGTKKVSYLCRLSSPRISLRCGTHNSSLLQLAYQPFFYTTTRPDSSRYEGAKSASGFLLLYQTGGCSSNVTLVQGGGAALVLLLSGRDSLGCSRSKALH